VAIPADLAPVGFSVSEVALLFAFLFLWLAITVLDNTRGPVVGLAGGVPIVGVALANALDRGLAAVRAWLYSNLSASLSAYSNLLSWLYALWAQLVATVEGFVTLSVSASFKITTQIIPAQIAQSLAVAHNLIAAAESRADAYAATLVAGVRAELAAAQAATVGLVAVARVEFTQLFTTAEADAIAQGAHAVAVAEDLAAAERAFTADQVAQLEARIQAIFTQSQAITAAAEAALRGDLGQVEQKLLQDIQQGASALEREIAAARSAIATGAVGVAAIAADVAALKALECLKYCAQLASLGSVLQVLNLAAIFGLVELMLHDPQGFNRLWLQDGQPLVSGTAAQVRSALGV